MNYQINYRDRRRNGLRVYLPSGTVAAAAAYAEGVVSVPSSYNPVLPFRDANGIRAFFFSNGADGFAFNYKVWLCHESYYNQDRSNPAESLALSLFGTGTATNGTASLLSNSEFLADLDWRSSFTTARIADTMTFALSAYGTHIVDNYQLATPTVYSPADNTIAWLNLPLLSRVCEGVILEIYSSASTERMNAVVGFTA